MDSPPALLVGGTGTEAESRKLQTTLMGLTEHDFQSLRSSSTVPGRNGPHVSAVKLIQVVTKTSQQNASKAWDSLKREGFFNTTGGCVIFYRFPGQRGRLSEVVNVPTALQIIMMLPGKTAAAVRLRASFLMVRFLAGDMTLVGEIYGLNQLQGFLQENDPTHPMCAFRQSVEAGQTGQTGTASSFVDAQHVKRMQDAEFAEAMAQIAAKRQRQFKLDIEDMECQAKIRRDESMKKHDLAMQEHGLAMQALNVRGEELKEAQKNSDIDKIASHAVRKTRVDKMVNDGVISREEGDQLLGESRVWISRNISISKILEKLWCGPKASLSRDLPHNLAQLFYEAYTLFKPECFPNKPLGDFRTDRGAPQNIMWYDVDLVDMWKYTEKLKVDEAKRKRNGTPAISFGATTTTSESSSSHVNCPSFEECRHKFGL
jgi:hypothetical protein